MHSWCYPVSRFELKEPSEITLAVVNDPTTPYTVHASVTLSSMFTPTSSRPHGGLRLRLRAPLRYAGKMSNVTVNGKSWSSFSAAEETVDFPASTLNADLRRIKIVAMFAA